MEFKIKDVTFTQEQLSTVKLTEITSQTISSYHFVHFLFGKKPLIMLRAADFIEPEFLTKYIEKGMQSLHCLEIAPKENINFYKSLLSKIKNANDQVELRKFSEDLLLNVFRKNIILKEESYLSFVIACFETFYSYPPHVLDKVQKTSMVLYTRSLISSSVSVLCGLLLGYDDFDFIQDLYNASFMMDYGLIEYDNFNYAISMACEAERKNPGKGLEILRAHKRSQGEIELYLNHPLISCEVAKEHAEIYHNPEVIDIIKYHHEKCDGSGFPSKLYYSSLSDFENILNFVDNLLPYDEHIFHIGDGKTILEKHFNNLKDFDSKYLLPVNKIIGPWAELIKYLEVNNEATA